MKDAGVTIKINYQLSAFNRIISARMKRMAFQYPAKREEKPIHHSVSGNGINGILGTGGYESTGRRKQGGKEQLIHPYQKDTCPSHYVNHPFPEKETELGAGRCL